MRRTRLQGAQAELFPSRRYHAFLTDRPGTAVWLDADHRRHATVELCIRDLKAGVGLRHCPSGKIAAWLLAALRRLRHLTTRHTPAQLRRLPGSAGACPGTVSELPAPSRSAHTGRHAFRSCLQHTASLLEPARSTQAHP